MTARIILGVDVGICGGLSVVVIETGVAPVLVDSIDVPNIGVNARRRVDAHAVRNFILKHSPQLAAIERTQAFPSQGRSSAYLFGRAAGALETVVTLCEIPLVTVEPSQWKRFYRLGRDKETARQKALELFPAAHALLARKRDHGRAEAAMIALFGARHEA
jgi:crossover junction endodeoxyribonuclease RuvC